MKTQIIEVITNKQQFFVVENESVVRLTEKKLEKYIPNFSDMTLEAREKHFKKWLKNDAYCICCVECGPQLPNARRKVRIPVLSDPVRGLPGRFDVRPIAAGPSIRVPIRPSHGGGR